MWPASPACGGTGRSHNGEAGGFRVEEVNQLTYASRGENVHMAREKWRFKAGIQWMDQTIRGINAEIGCDIDRTLTKTTT